MRVAEGHGRDIYLVCFFQVAVVPRMCAALLGKIKGMGGNFLSFR